MSRLAAWLGIHPPDPVADPAHLGRLAQRVISKPLWHRLSAAEQARALRDLSELVRALGSAGVSRNDIHRRLVWTRESGFGLTRGHRAPGKLDPNSAGWADFLRLVNAQGLLCHGTDANGDPVLMPFEQFERHMVVQGLSGTGKSKYLAGLIAQLATRGGPLVLIDPHGDLIRDVIPILPPERLGDVVYIDPSDPHRSWGINALQMARTLVDESAPDFAQTMNQVIEDSVNAIVHALSIIQEDTSGYSSGPSIQSMMSMGALATTEREDTSFVDFYSLLTNPDIRDIAIDEIARGVVSDYFQFTYRELKTEYIERVRNKLDPFMQTTMVNLFSRRDECMSLKQMIEGNRIILVDLNTAKLPLSLSNLIGYIFITLIMFVVDRREGRNEGRCKPLFLFVDEFSNVASKTTVRWFAQARKMRAGLVAAFQHRAQLPDEISAALANAGIKAVFRSSGEDARQLTPAMGLADSAGRPRIDDLAQLPDYHMQLQSMVAGPGASAPNVTVTVRTFPKVEPPANAAEIIERVVERSKRLYAKPANPTDTQTVYTANDAGSRQVLGTIYEATLAVERGAAYVLPTDEPKVHWALGHRHVTYSLITALLEAKGITITPKRVGQLRRTLATRKLIRMRKTTEGLDTTELTEAGLAAVRAALIPGASSNEGGLGHKESVFLLHQALCSLGPMPLEIPDQRTGSYTPDLVLSPATAAGHLASRICRGKPVHLHVEESTRHNPTHIADNLLRAYNAGADPILILNRPGPSVAVLRDVGGLVYRLAFDLKGRQGSPPALPGALAASGLRFRTWILTPGPELLEYRPDLDTVEPVVLVYGPREAKPPRSTGEGAEFPRPKGP